MKILYGLILIIGLSATAKMIVSEWRLALRSRPRRISKRKFDRVTRTRGPL